MRLSGFQVGFGEFDDLAAGIEVAIAGPYGTHTEVRDAWPGLARGAVGIGREVDLLDAVEFRAFWLVGDTFQLHRNLCIPANYERDPGQAAKIGDFARGFQRVEYQLEAVCNSNADNGGFGLAGGRDSGENAQAVLSKELKQLRPSHRGSAPPVP